MRFLILFFLTSLFTDVVLGQKKSRNDGILPKEYIFSSGTVICGYDNELSVWEPGQIIKGGAFQSWLDYVADLKDLRKVAKGKKKKALTKKINRFSEQLKIEFKTICKNLDSPTKS
jgi:hypothetical protein